MDLLFVTNYKEKPGWLMTLKSTKISSSRMQEPLSCQPYTVGHKELNEPVSDDDDDN